jgi:hypothetical protein
LFLYVFKDTGKCMDISVALARVNTNSSNKHGTDWVGTALFKYAK